ncbi:uncharacterized protein LOC143913344 isoform X2 [Arctopsyche grandis]|uniref:uncharacterized protein LOC143913344 isoform X2 n=2 Tax=Arctopsyche grandis TaxID=121162 RepID=UPI00406D8352
MSNFIIYVVAFIFTVTTVLCQTNSRVSPNIEQNIKDIYGEGTAQTEGAFQPSDTATDKFDWNLFETISNDNRENVLVSPFGLKFALAMLFEVSSGKTNKEIEQVLEFNSKKSITTMKFKKALDSLLERNENYIMNFASRLYLDSSITPNTKHATILESSYKTVMTKMDVNNPAQTAKNANEWVKKITNGNVEDLLSEDDLKDAVVILLNGMFFKGTWEHQFLTNATKQGFFKLNASRAISAPFMTQTNYFYYYHSKTLDAKMLRMPYKGGKFAMNILLPDTLHGLADLISRVNSEKIKRDSFLVDNTLVKVSLPVFKFNYLSRFVPILEEMGIRELFGASASLPGIAMGRGITEKISVSNILQKAGIDVNELGSTAYAATEVTLVNKFGVEDYTEEFIADKPFLFYIEDESTKQILFMGKIEDPSNLSDGAAPSIAAPPLKAPPTSTPKASSPQSIQSQSKPAVTIVTPSPADRNPNKDFSLTPTRPFRPSFSKRLNNFDVQLLRDTAETATSSNFMISPASIKSVLIMIYEGARGNTAEEIKSVLRLPADQAETRNLLNVYLSKLQVQTPGVIVESANKVFLSNRYNVNQDYEAVLSDMYRSKVDRIDFGQPNTAANVINNWVSGTTHGHISELVDGASLDPNTILMLANALYFKGTWESAFDEKVTSKKCFYVNDNCILTPTMENEGEYKYALIDDSFSAQVIELLYQGGKYSMLIVLPTEKNGLKTLLRDFSQTSLQTILDQLESTEVQLNMPKFTIDYSDDMTNILKKMGINDLFTSRANLTGMIHNGNPHVDQVAHKTRIEVNEKGSIAAAATGAMVVPLMGGTTARMTIDHPFIFLIRENDSGAILFAGRVQQPDQSSVIEDSLSKFQINQDNQNYNSRPAYQGAASGSSQNFNSQSNYQGSAASNQNLNSQPTYQQPSNQNIPISRAPETYNNQAARYPTSNSGSSGVYNTNKFTTEQPNRNVPYNTNSQVWQGSQPTKYDRARTSR